ncbi:hypothetical protein NQ317_001591 [Molorchus minor]|uniref:Uncharacterized protein n=1 Tax=Molorchus minor TaxID=1323400 RepID=A0ABQ9IVN8_9CUCU|nr:hypothetical protein NQ317_001591 [Molorchus minor]
MNGGIPLPGIYTGSTGTPLTNGGIHNQSGYNSQTAFVIDFDADNFKITNSKIPDRCNHCKF